MDYKAIIVGDSQTFLMSKHIRINEYISSTYMANGEELFPRFWVSFLNNLEDSVIYCWRMTTSARTLDYSILDNIFKQNKVIQDAILNKTIVVFSFGALDFHRYINTPINIKPVVKKYFYEVINYCKKNNIDFRFASPITNSKNSHMIDIFNDELDLICLTNNVSKVIRYENTNINYKSFTSVDRWNHPPLDLLESAGKHIISSI